VVEHYLEMQAALADDDFEKATKAGTAMVEAADEARPEGAARAVELWTRLREEYARHGKHLAMVRNLAQAREAFDGFSQVTSRLLARFGNPTDKELRVAFCPMAFENRGAEWIQATDQVDNSYFGEEMLSCGEIRHTIGAGEYLMSEPGEESDSAGGDPQ
jgi:Cu(I)/Ag(I) efflux system membrane fusion protein